MLADTWSSIDWPNVLAGTIIPLLLAFPVWVIKGAYNAWKISKQLPYVKVVGSWPQDDPDNDTAWKLDGSIHLCDTFIGNWHTTAKNTKRFDSACIKIF